MENNTENPRGARTRWALVLYISLAVQVVSSLILLLERSAAMSVVEVVARFLAFYSLLLAKRRKEGADCRIIFKIDVAYLLFANTFSLIFVFALRGLSTFFAIVSLIMSAADIVVTATFFFVFETKKEGVALSVAAWCCFAVYAVLSLLLGNSSGLGFSETAVTVFVVLVALFNFAWFFLLALCKEDRIVGDPEEKAG